MRRGLDFAVAFVILALSFGLYLVYFGGAAGAGADIFVNGSLYKSVSLNDTGDYEIDSGGYHVVLRADNGRIRFIESDCPDKVCVNTGWISEGGRVAACVPSGIVVRIGGESTDIDTVLQ